MSDEVYRRLFDALGKIGRGCYAMRTNVPLTEGLSKLSGEELRILSELVDGGGGTGALDYHGIGPMHPAGYRLFWRLKWPDNDGGSKAQIEKAVRESDAEAFDVLKKAVREVRQRQS